MEYSVKLANQTSPAVVTEHLQTAWEEAKTIAWNLPRESDSFPVEVLNGDGDVLLSLEC